MKRIALIVAGGSGTRMGTEQPKQFLLLKGRPVLMHSIEKFARHSDVYVVLPENWMEYWKTLCIAYDFRVEHMIIKGGSKRAHSVKAGLDLLTADGIVAVHDAARPLISELLIEKLFQAASEKGNAIPFIRPGDSMRILEKNMNKAVDRHKYVLVQTPQCFRIKELKNAFERMHFSDFTDEASLMEAFGISINLIEGEYTNIKITLPVDLQYAETCVL